MEINVPIGTIVREDEKTETRILSVDIDEKGDPVLIYKTYKK